MTPHLRIAAVVALALGAITTAPYVIAARRAPAGAVFTGAFFYQDDMYQYFSFVDQAARGELVFANKFDPRPQRPAVINVEWWSAGVLARILGGSPILGFHALRILAIFGLMAAAARLLSAAGLAGGRLAGALVLFATAGGLGWLRLLMETPGWRVPDVLLGLYPFHQSLMNAHFVVGTALLLWTVVLFLEHRAGRRRAWWWVATGTALGLSRPYELVVFVLVAGALIALDLARRRIGALDALHATLRLSWLAPVFLYYAALMLGPAGVEGWTGVRSGDLTPPLAEFALALAPATVLAAVFWRRAPTASGTVREALAVLSGVVALIVAAYPSPMAKQFATSLGPAVVLLAALVTPPRWLAPAALALAPTSAFLMWRVLNPYPGWFAPRDEIAAVRHLEDACRAGDVALAPTDLSLRIAGLTPCSVAFGHRCLTPDWPAAVEAGRRFYDASTPASWRAGYVRDVRARFVFLPPGAASWLGEEHRLVRRLSFTLFEVWEVADQDPGG